MSVRESCHPAAADRLGAVVEPVPGVYRRRRPRITRWASVGSVAALLFEVCGFLVAEELPAIELVRPLERRQGAVVSDTLQIGRAPGGAWRGPTAGVSLALLSCDQGGRETGQCQQREAHSGVEVVHRDLRQWRPLTPTDTIASQRYLAAGFTSGDV